MWHILRLVALICLSAASAQAQTSRTANPWAHGTELAILVGGATTPSTTGPMIAGTAAWEVTRWVAIEGRGSWFDRGSDATAFAADLSALVNLIAKRPVTPFLGAGFGLYRASFSGAAPAMSDFYRARMTSSRASVFTDPAVRFTAGVDVIARRYWTLRPEVSVLTVRSGGHGEWVVTGGVSVGYRFEDHRITPMR
jgi:hypothetical protein